MIPARPLRKFPSLVGHAHATGRKDATAALAAGQVADPTPSATTAQLATMFNARGRPSVMAPLVEAWLAAWQTGWESIAGPIQATGRYVLTLEPNDGSSVALEASGPVEVVESLLGPGLRVRPGPGGWAVTQPGARTILARVARVDQP